MARTTAQGDDGAHSVEQENGIVGLLDTLTHENGRKVEHRGGNGKAVRSATLVGAQARLGLFHLHLEFDGLHRGDKKGQGECVDEEARTRGGAEDMCW